jgi:hypothetical protein
VEGKTGIISNRRFLITGYLVDKIVITWNINEENCALVLLYKNMLMEGLHWPLNELRNLQQENVESPLGEVRGYMQFRLSNRQYEVRIINDKKGLFWSLWLCPLDNVTRPCWAVVVSRKMGEKCILLHRCIWECGCYPSIPSWLFWWCFVWVRARFWKKTFTAGVIRPYM